MGNDEIVLQFKRDWNLTSRGIDVATNFNSDTESSFIALHFSDTVVKDINIYIKSKTRNKRNNVSYLWVSRLASSVKNLVITDTITLKKGDELRVVISQCNSSANLNITRMGR